MTVEGRAKKAASDNPVLKGLLHPGQTYLSVTEKITEVVLTRDTPLAWMIGSMSVTTVAECAARITW